jgi:hypothetical protein
MIIMDFGYQFFDPLKKLIFKMYESYSYKYMVIIDIMFGSNKNAEIIKATYHAQNLKVYNLLDENNIKPSSKNLVDEMKQNLLHIAVRGRNYVLVEYFVDNDVSQTDKNIFNETPLDIAIKNNDKEMVELLCGHGKLENHKKTIKKLEDKCDDYRMNYEKVASINFDLKTQVESFNKSNQRLREVYDTVNNQLKSEHDTYKKTLQMCERLKEDNKGLKYELDTLKISTKRMRDNYDENDRANKKFRTEYGILEIKHNQVVAENKVLKKDIGMLQTQYGTLKQDYGVLQVTVNNLRDSMKK